MTLADCTVMVVEDHEFQRRTMLQILANLGAGTLLEAADGEDALALLSGDPRPDIVVCDLDMPGMDGVEFLRHVSERGAGTAIVIASGLDEGVLRSAEATARGYGLEVLGAIRKPLTARLLLRAVGLHRPQQAPRVDASAFDEDPAGEDPWTAALRDGRIAMRVLPRAELGSGRLGALEVRAVRVGDAVDAASDPRNPLPEATAVAVAERVAREGLDMLRLLVEAGEHVDVTLVLPPAALTGAAMIERLAELATAAGVDLARICVALPDSGVALPGSSSAAATAPLDVLTRLRVRGFGLGIDGFGVARTTLRELSPLPLTEVKVAAEVVARAASSRDGAQAFAATVQALVDQGLDVVCDGCDTRAAWDLALQAGCRRAQGAVVSSPLGPDALPAWLEHWTGVA